MSGSTETRTQWFSAGGGFLRRGPYETQEAAYRGMLLTEDARARQRRERGVDMPYPHDVRVWPEYQASP